MKIPDYLEEDIKNTIFEYLKKQPVIEAHHTDATLFGMSIMLCSEIIKKIKGERLFLDRMSDEAFEDMLGNA